MSSTSKAYNLPGSAYALRDEGSFHDRRTLPAEAGHRDRWFTLLEARRRVAVSCADEPQASGLLRTRTATMKYSGALSSDSTTTSIFSRLQHGSPPLDRHSTSLVLSHRSKAILLRQRHLRYYASIRHK
ncbi:uncharacterized protein LOC142575020 [Dermacentor variabilis]|uniref:uncharacterized protein LOC142575020 n=1 Tax=Dermacentor variabilis TaxID=34621 RepID=UPI003F5B24A7